MQVSQVAKTLQITPETVRFYTRRGLLNPKKDNENGYRYFSDTDVSQLKFILGARKLGFSVNEIELILSEAEKGKSPCPIVRKLILEHLAETEKQFQEMLALRQRMKDALAEWEVKPDKMPTGKMICHLIENCSHSHQV